MLASGVRHGFSLLKRFDQRLLINPAWVLLILSLVIYGLSFLTSDDWMFYISSLMYDSDGTYVLLRLTILNWAICFCSFLFNIVLYAYMLVPMPPQLLPVTVAVLQEFHVEEKQ